MELPQQLTTDLKIVQHQIKLEIQTHQIMRTKQANDPNNFKLDDLRAVEKRISSLGEKQNQLMRWLRKILTTLPSSNDVMAKTASSLGIAINGKHLCTETRTNHITKTKCSSVLKSNNINNTKNSLKDHIKSNCVKPAKEKKGPNDLTGEQPINIESKDKNCEIEGKCVSQTVHENGLLHHKTAKHLQNIAARNKQAAAAQIASLCEPLTVEKERFLSAVGLVTREVLKDLQNRRVERKRRSTANHTQFVYGSNWEIFAKKRKKSNYLTSGAKQPVTRQAARTQIPLSEIPFISAKLSPTVTVFKTPLPISSQSQTDITDDAVNTSISLKTVLSSQKISNDEINVDHAQLPDTTASVTLEAKRPESCFVCQKTDTCTIGCSCGMHYHCACGEIVENCVGCGVKLINNMGDRRTEKHHLQEMNNRLNSEKEELEIRAAELSVTLASQVEKKKNLLCMEEDVRRKIQHIHDFITVMKNSQSVPPL